jgi:hypothetical protein
MSQKVSSLSDFYESELGHFQSQRRIWFKERVLRGTFGRNWDEKNSWPEK